MHVVTILHFIVAAAMPFEDQSSALSALAIDKEPELIIITIFSHEESAEIETGELDFPCAET